MTRVVLQSGELWMLTNKQMIFEVNLPYGQAEFKVDPDLRSIRITPFDQQFESRNHNFYFSKQLHARFSVIRTSKEVITHLLG